MNTQETYRALTEVNIKAIRVAIANDDMLFERARAAGMMSLLYEAEAEGSKSFDNGDAQKLQVQVKQAIEAIDELSTGVAANMPNLKGILDSLKKGLPNDADIGSLVKLDAKALPKQVADVSKKISQVAMTKAAIMNMLTQFGESLASVIGELDPQDQKKTLGDLAKQSTQAGGKLKSGGKEVKFPTQESLAKALQKAYTVPNFFMQAVQRGVGAAKEESGGFFAKGLAALKSVVFGETKPPNLKFDGIADDFMKMTAEQLSGEVIAKLKEQAEKEKERAAGVGEATAQAASGAASGNVSTAGGGGGAAGGDETAARAELLKKQKLSQWSQLAQKDPKAFAELVNAAANDKILATEASARWSKLAGIKEIRRR